MVEAVRFASKAAAKAEVERLVEERAEGGRNRLDEALAIVRAWGLDEDAVRELFKEADEVGTAAQAQIWIEGQEALLKNSTVQPERARPKAEVAKPKPKQIVGWRQTSNGSWEYLLEGETVYRRHF